MSNDQIVITGIRGTGHHGVFDYERRDGQEFAVDITLFLQAGPASTTDELKDTVDYGGVAQVVFDRIVGEPVEALIDRICLDLGLDVPPPEVEGDHEGVEGVAAHSGLRPACNPLTGFAGAPPQGEQQELADYWNSA